MKHIMRTTPSHGIEAFKKWGEDEKMLNDHLERCKADVHKAMCGKNHFGLRAFLEVGMDPSQCTIG